MKKNGILNSDISRILSYLGHTDELTIADCGLPIPENTERIDISLRLGEPSFISTFEEIKKDMAIEKIILANEIKEKNPELLEKIYNLIDENIEIEFINHEDLKLRLQKSKAVIRTGENTPFANMILISSVIF